MLKIYLLSDKGVREESDLQSARQACKDKGCFVWVDLRSYTGEEVALVGEAFQLHSTAIDALRTTYTRPHISEFENHFYVNFTLLETARGHDLKPSEFHVFLSQDFVITASENGGGKIVDKVLERYGDTPSLAERGTYYALYLLVELLTDSYFPIAEKLDDQVDHIEEEMLHRADQRSLKELFRVKRRLFELRRYLGPQRDVFNELARRDFPFVEENYQPYFQDVYNRMIRVFDIVDTARDILSGTLDLYQSTVANRLNDIMKVLTIFAIILGILTLITGFFGMNFRYFPGLDMHGAIPLLLIVMAAIAVAMIYWFRRMKWL